MPSNRDFIFDNGNKKIQFTFGDYALILYYSEQLNANNAEYLFFCTLTEYQYRNVNNLPVNGIDPDDEIAHFNLREYQLALDFIDNELMPAMSSETNDLFVKYGGLNGFENLLSAEKGFLECFGLCNSDCYNTDPQDLWYIIKSIRDMISWSISNLKPYTIILND